MILCLLVVIACIRPAREFPLGACAIEAFGMTEADILKSYPTLVAEDLVNAWAYEQSHREEIDRQIAENERN